MVVTVLMLCWGTRRSIPIAARSARAMGAKGVRTPNAVSASPASSDPVQLSLLARDWTHAPDHPAPADRTANQRAGVHGWTHAIRAEGPLREGPIAPVTGSTPNSYSLRAINFEKGIGHHEVPELCCRGSHSRVIGQRDDDLPEVRSPLSYRGTQGQRAGSRTRTRARTRPARGLTRRTPMGSGQSASVARRS